MSETPPDLLPDSSAEIPSSPYALETVSHLSADQLERLTGVFRDIGVDGWLERNSLSRLELSKKVLIEGVAVNGVYSFVDRSIQVATARDKREYGHAFEWQRVYSVSSTALTPLEAIQRTLIHELGHHVHNSLYKLDPFHFLETQHSVLIRGGTTYAQDNELEYFAESFALYVFYSAELLTRDPDGYGMIEKALERLEVEVKQR